MFKRKHKARFSDLYDTMPEETLPYSRTGSLKRVLKSSLRRKRRELDISQEDPTYSCVYLGNAATLHAKGEGSTDQAVKTIWTKSNKGKSGSRMKLSIGNQGITLTYADKDNTKGGQLYMLHRITYCVADKNVPRIFAWIYRHEVKLKAVMLRCHAVYVKKEETAKAMALLLYQTFSTSLENYKREKKESERHRERAGIPWPMSVPRRKLIKSTVEFKPPVERSRSAPKLGCITEDDAEDAHEEQEALNHCEPPAHRHFTETIEEEDEEEEEEGNGRYQDAEGEGDSGIVSNGDDEELLSRGVMELDIGNNVHDLQSDQAVATLMFGDVGLEEEEQDYEEEETRL
ncbi:PREDICTED: protein FAM43A-like [Branchiostoma belcheri]|uniref:Protein FAM43A-like n=1 Tax=Branchiostoma belcheri TaxID=7741 RepID=A0A6P5AU34_BRABE|nr:PREDICTED: protein FAM43A-like [Branchiostoma belcheri]